MKIQSLAKGATIGLVCPGSTTVNAADAEKVKTILQQRYQLNAVYQSHVHTWCSAEQRAQILLHYFQDENIDLIWTLRGGEGSADLIPFFEQHYAKLKALPAQTLVGFSDITALLVYFAEQYHWPVIHGIGASALIKPEYAHSTIEQTMDLLFNPDTQIRINDLIPLNDLAKSNQIMSAPLTGGNLSLLNISVADSWQIDARGKIIFIEDVNEKAHSVIRTLKYLKRVGLLNEVKALICGHFLGLEPDSEQQHEANNILRVLTYFAKECDFPVVKTDLIGHGANNLPIILGANATLSLGSEFSLTIN